VVPSGASGSPLIRSAGPERTIPTDKEKEMNAATTEHTDHTGTRRFSEGVEQLPDTPEKRSTGRFSRGIERWPNTPEKGQTRRFSHGIEQFPDTPEKRALGRFSRGSENELERSG
jgi:hypothetical protein